MPAASIRSASTASCSDRRDPPVLDQQIAALHPALSGVADQHVTADEEIPPHPGRVEVLPMPRLRRVDCSSAGIRRVGRGRGFSYEEADGRAIVDREVIERIRELAIPPAWKEVWICPHPNGHIQATGIDDGGPQAVPLPPALARGTATARSSPRWRRFAKALPAMRERTDDDLARRGLVRDRVLACSVRLLDLGFFRIGSERYAEENETFGLATLRRSTSRSSAASPASTTRRRAPSATTRRSPTR